MGRVGRGITALRVFTLNALFMLGLLIFAAFVIGLVLAHNAGKVEEGSVLLVAPVGALAEQPPQPDPMALLSPDSDRPAATQHVDLLRALRAAAKDSRIKAVVIKSADLGPGLARIEEVNSALAAVKLAGKPVLAWGDRFDQTQYLLASNASRVYLDPDGEVAINGLSRHQMYYHSLLERLGVKMHVFKVGTYKSAVEPYIRDSMSDADKEAAISYLGDTWARLTGLIAERRKLKPEAVQAYADLGAEKLREAGGNSAEMARRAGLVDEFATAQSFDEMIKKRFGADREGRAPRYVTVANYAATLDAADVTTPSKVGIVVIDGVIMEGASRAGVVGSASVVKTIEDAAHDKTVKALVLRVNSPGGSATASEEIRRALQRAREAGKPVVVSMSTVAASGGYWVSMASDRIYAEPTSITGSIGIFGVLPEIAEPLSKLGINTDGVTTAPDAGQPNPATPLSDHMADRLDQQIRYGYARFVAVVAKGRKLSPEAVEAVAQGRVWTGKQALEHKLVDKLGGLEDALAYAAEKAGLKDYAPVYVVPERSSRARLIAALMGADAQGKTLEMAGPAAPALAGFMQELELLTSRERIFARCLCEGL